MNIAMRQFNQFIALVFTRQTLGFALLLSLALLVWFAGPELALGSLRPFSEDAIRIACVLLLLSLAVLWLASGPLSLVAVAAGCVLVWQAGPSLSFANVRPLEPVWARGMLIGILVLGCSLYWLQRLLANMRADDDFLASVLSFGQRRSADDPAKDALRDVEETMRRAVAQLRASRLRGGLWSRIFERRRYLYELPWFVVLGAAGAGKSTALRSAGLQFPLPPQIGRRTRQPETGAAIGEQKLINDGTLHCDWWFANEAVLIDTAGRYATHDVDASKDPAEWAGFLGLLRKYRTRAPINGVLVVLSIAQILQMSPSERLEHAARLRDRLLELRQSLGIRFPVYVVVTKTDVLQGFTAYFQSLTAEGRSQVWGFTLPFDDGRGRAPDKSGSDQIGEALTQLEDRLAEGLRARMSEEFDGENRRVLAVLPAEFSGAVHALRQVLDPMFHDSRFDVTQRSAMLRGVYFTSGAQSLRSVPADRFTLLERLRPPDATRSVDTRPHHPGQGFFLQDVLKKVIFPEAHLVRPNLRWELRFRLLRLVGHVAAVMIFAWLANALSSSFSSNRDYLKGVERRTAQLSEQVRLALAQPQSAGAADLLDGAHALTAQTGLDVAHPPTRFTYGLYSVPPAVEAAAKTYSDLQFALLLPPTVRRMEQVLAQSLLDRDNRTAYETLRVYKLIHDREQYIAVAGGTSIRDWLRRDSQTLVDAIRGGANDASGMAALVSRPSMAAHFDALFAEGRVVQAASLADESLIRSVQSFLDSDTATERIYERAKLSMQLDAPSDFTLVRAVGPQVGSVFLRKDALPLDKGVPGLFTYDGYHRIFAPRIVAFVGAALKDDDWVMGRDTASTREGRLTASDEWVLHVRRQYLTEYALHWDEFLSSVRAIGFVDGSNANAGLGLDLGVLRQLAAPDSPLTRLARAAVRETTLSTPLAVAPADAAAAVAAAAADTIPLGRQLERELVDSRFAALREVVTGSADVVAKAPDGTSGRPRIDAVSGLINDFYTWMVVADTALSSGGLPPGGWASGSASGAGLSGGDAGARLRLEAGKLPAPFKEILLGVAVSSADKVAQGATGILHRQAQLHLDRLMGLMALQVGEPCKRGVEGRYPLALVAQDASIEDFESVFASGGALDEFFSKNLASLVDTSVRPWRYRSPGSANAYAGAEAIAGGLPSLANAAASATASATAFTPADPSNPTAPTLLGELLKLLPRDGPNLDAFYRAQQIRNVFFREAGGKKLTWKMELSVRELEPSITELSIDVDGQIQRYVHGPVHPLNVVWPGPRGGVTAELTAQPRVAAATSTLLLQGPWAVFRLIEKGRLAGTATAGKASVEFLFDGRKALLEIGTGSQPNPLNSDLLRGFRCPGRTA